MKIEMIKTEDLIPYENNPRKNDDAVEAVANSIKEFGFQVPIVIDKENVIVSGHTRLKAAEQLGLKEVPCVRADKLTDEQIKASRIADNKTGELSIWDNEALKEELKLLQSSAFDMTDFGFGEFELSMLTQDFAPEPYKKEDVEEYAENEDQYLAKRRVIITYSPEDEQKVCDKLGLEALDKVVYDISEII